MIAAPRCKDNIEELEKERASAVAALEAQMAALEVAKKQAVDDEDFLKASELKTQILALKAQQ